MTCSKCYNNCGGKLVSEDNPEIFWRSQISFLHGQKSVKTETFINTQLQQKQTAIEKVLSRELMKILAIELSWGTIV